jgi:hypothetical protein
MSAPSRANVLTLVSAPVSLAKKVVVVNGTVCRTDDPRWPRIYGFTCAEVDGLDDLYDMLTVASRERPAPCIVRAEPHAEVGRRALYDDAEKGPAGMFAIPRAWTCYDIEKVPADGIDPMYEPLRVVAKARQCLPPEHHDTSAIWQLSANAGRHRDQLRCHLWFLFDRPLLGRQIETWCQPGIASGWLDPCTLRNEICPHFLAVDVEGDAADPCPQRWGLIRGDRERVPVPEHVTEVAKSATCRPYHGPEGGNLNELKRWYGPRFDLRRHEAVGRIRTLIEGVKASATGARHPTYCRAAASIAGICKYWCIKIEEPRKLLEAAYLETLTPDEARKRARGSTQGVWDWIARRDVQ